MRTIVLVAATTSAAVARADEPPPPEGTYVYPGSQPSAPAQPVPPPPAPAPATPPPPPVQPDGFTVDRHGVMLLGGFLFSDGDRSQFAVIYVPVPLPAAPRLKIGFTGSFQYQRAFVDGTNDLEVWVYLLQPMVQYDWRMPIASRMGDFAIAAEGGIDFGQIWIKFPSEAFMPPGWQHISFVGLHTDAAFQFHGHSGLVVSLQPIGIDVPLNSPAPPSPGWTVTTKLSYSFALAAGYRFR